MQRNLAWEKKPTMTNISHMTCKTGVKEVNGVQCDSIACTLTTAGYLHMLNWNLFAITVWYIACVCLCGCARFNIEEKK